MNEIVTHLLAPKSSKETISKLVTFFGSMAGTVLFKKVDEGSLVSMLRGKSEASPKILKMAKLVASFKNDPTMTGMIIDYGLKWLDQKGFARDDILSAAKSYAPILDVKMDVATMEEFASAVVQIADNIVAGDDTIVHTAIIDCPKCRYMFMV